MTQKRSIEQMENDRSKIRSFILENFQNREFTMGDVYYSFNNTWNKRKFGEYFVDMVALTKEGFLKYRMGLRHSGKYNSLKRGAIYSLKNS